MIPLTYKISVLLLYYIKFYNACLNCYKSQLRNSVLYNAAMYLEIDGATIICTVYHNIVNGLTREYLTTLLPYEITGICTYDLRYSTDLRPIKSSTDGFGKSFTSCSITGWEI